MVVNDIAPDATEAPIEPCDYDAPCSFHADLQSQEQTIRTPYMNSIGTSRVGGTLGVTRHGTRRGS